MTWKKRIISIVLCLCALLCAASVRAEAADHSHPICGGTTGTTCTHAGDKHTSNVPWTAWDGTTTINNDFFGNSTEKYLYLSQDVTPGVCITVPEGKTLYLCLNGHSLKSKDYYAISVSGTLVLCDCNSSGQGKGVISHGKKDNGSLYGADGIYVVDNAIFTMYGGTISNNDGSGVLVSGGTFTMYGGEISHNTRTTSSAEGGGGVWVKNYKSSKEKIPGNFAMYGGTICNNEIQSSTFGGGGVGMDSDGSFYMENGTITGNKCNNSGGGLDIRCKTITIKGNSTISGNTCGGEGGGIFAISSGESSITNCTISGNNATGTNSKGGGLAFQNSTFTLEKCTIIDNKTTGKGGAICLMTDNAYGPLAAHAWQPATCTAPKTCSVCHTTEGTALGHAWQPTTCTAPKTCTACHVTDGAALGHDWGAWKVTTPATKDAPGVETRTCTHNSAHTETRSIPKLSTAVYTVSDDTKIAQIEAKVDGLDKILELNENRALVNDGKSVGVSLTVKNTASSGVSEKIKEKLAGSNLVGLRLELTVEKTVTANGVVESKQTIPDAGVLLKTTITLPAELQGKSGYVVYRLHDGNVHVLTETANENGEFISVSADKTQITICARLYSEYVIAYQTGGSSGGGYHPVNPTPVKATSANTGDAGVLLYGVTAALSLTGTAWLGAKSRKH